MDPQDDGFFVYDPRVLPLCVRRCKKHTIETVTLAFDTLIHQKNNGGEMFLATGCTLSEAGFYIIQRLLVNDPGVVTRLNVAVICAELNNLQGSKIRVSDCIDNFSINLFKPKLRKRALKQVIAKVTGKTLTGSQFKFLLERLKDTHIKHII